MSQFFVKLLPPRASFPFDMSAEEKASMEQHAVYWRGLLREGRVYVFGPVMDPAGVYGMGVIEADTEDEVKKMLAGDPAAELMRTEFYPMQAVTTA